MSVSPVERLTLQGQNGPKRTRQKSLATVSEDEDTIGAGAGLRQLDKRIEIVRKTSRISGRNAPKSRDRISLREVVLVLAMSSLVGIVFYPPPTWATCENSCAQAFDGTCDDGGVEGWPFDAQKAGNGGSCALGSDCGDCGPRNFAIPKWFFIVACLVTTALLLVGVQETARIVHNHLGRDVWTNVSTFTRIRVPLTDFPFGTAMVNRIMNSTQVREKSLKVIQYTLKGLVFSGKLSKERSKQFKSLAKMTSVARRFFKFLRWVKHFEDFQEVRDQKSKFMAFLLLFRIAANFGADWAEDVCSLERVGVLTEGTLSVEFMLFAEYCQLALALVEILVTSVKVNKELEITVLTHQEAKTREAGVCEEKLLKQDRKLALVRLELIKYVSDVGKAIFDCELPYASERVFIGCSLFSGILSTHKNMVKILK
eukprot:TRINITY_DN49368_c0_g1_i1.p1 TRINITY_DN49368_c0_g1~~TRINITY_DN49368_c0_g1_i1.p1  ORF type:complete len:427 (+),score=85.28 TRINITY_DN49368_c0_g1_i1:51-1331(+)